MQATHDKELKDFVLNALLSLWSARGLNKCNLSEHQSSAYLYKWTKGRLKKNAVHKLIKKDIKALLSNYKKIGSAAALEQELNELYAQYATERRLISQNQLLTFVNDLANAGWHPMKARPEDLPYPGVDKDVIFMEHEVNNAFTPDGKIKPDAKMTFFVFGDFKELLEIALSNGLIMKVGITGINKKGLRETRLEMTLITDMSNNTKKAAA